MAQIKKIKENISQLTIFLDESDLLLANNPENFAVKSTVKNIKSQIDELQNQLYQENLKREKEIVQLRFKGTVADFGTFPLSMVGGLTNSFSNALFNTSKQFQFGNIVKTSRI